MLLSIQIIRITTFHVVYCCVLLQHYMHKSSIVRAKLLAKDSNLGNLLITSALRKSNKELHNIEGGEGDDDTETSLLYGDVRPSDSQRDTDLRDEDTVFEEDVYQPEGRLDSKSFLLDSPHTSMRILMDSRQLLLDDKSLIKDVMRSQQCSEVLKPYRWERD